MSELLLTVDRAQPDRCRYHLKGPGNSTTIVSERELLIGERFRLIPADSAGPDTWELWTEMPYEDCVSDYTVKRGRSRIRFRDTTDVWNWDSYFRLLPAK